MSSPSASTVRSAILDHERPSGSRTTWWIEALAATVVAVVYLAAPRSAPSAATVGAAERRGAALFEWERSWGIAIEPALQSSVAAAGLEWLANWLYGSLHFIVTAAAFVLLLRLRPEAYPRWRTSFVVASVGAFAMHRWLPVAPPRLVPDGRGSTLMSDWLAQHPTPWSFESGPISEVANHYAALPSMHVGWAVLSAVAIGSASRGRWRTAVVLGYPLLVTLVVMATGNHYLVDALAGAATAVGALLVVRSVEGLLRRWRRGRAGSSERPAPLDAGDRAERPGPIHGTAAGTTPDPAGALEAA
jgi:hypothetical protein